VKKRPAAILTAILTILVATNVYTLYMLHNIQHTQVFLEVDVYQRIELENFVNREELEDFLRDDTTDMLTYGKNFTCLSFAHLLSGRAKSQGKNVVVLWDAWRYNITDGHAYCMAYSEADRTYYIIEPQSDMILWGWKLEEE